MTCPQRQRSASPLCSASSPSWPRGLSQGPPRTPCSILGQRLMWLRLECTAAQAPHPEPAQPYSQGNLLSSLGSYTPGACFRPVPVRTAGPAPSSQVCSAPTPGALFQGHGGRSYFSLAARPGSRPTQPAGPGWTEQLECLQGRYPGAGEAGGGESRGPRTEHAAGETFPERPPSAPPTTRGSPHQGSHRLRGTGRLCDGAAAGESGNAVSRPSSTITNHYQSFPPI